MRGVYLRVGGLLVLGLILTIVGRVYYLNYGEASASTGGEKPVGIHLLLSNADSDLEQTRRMEYLIGQFMRRWEINGASLAIMKDGKLLYSKGFGLANMALEEPVEVSHLFRLASFSKLITAAGVMKLKEQGLLSLDDKVFGEQGILSDSIFLQIRDPQIRNITVEHLLRHRGGFSIRSGDPLFSFPSVARQLERELPLTLDDMVEYASRTRLRYRPGSSNLYSNLGYVVLTKVIERVSGQPYQEYIQEQVLRPAGCTDMHLGYSEYWKRYPNEVNYYEPSDAEPVLSYNGSGLYVPRSYGGTDLQVLSGAGGWIASPTELLKLICALDPNDHHPDILSRESIAYMTAYSKEEYPIGWMHTNPNGTWERTGSLAGTSLLMKRQGDGYTWVFVTNTSSWSGSRFPSKVEVLMRQALDRVKQWPQRDLFEVESRPVGVHEDAPLTTQWEYEPYTPSLESGISAYSYLECESLSDTGLF